jgi:hypothetical protein
MKKMFAVILSLLFLVTSSFFVMGCQKAEEQKPAEVKTVAPAPAPAPAVTTAGTTPAPAVPPAAPAATTPAAK